MSNPHQAGFDLLILFLYNLCPHRSDVAFDSDLLLEYVETHSLTSKSGQRLGVLKSVTLELSLYFLGTDDF